MGYVKNCAMRGSQNCFPRDLPPCCNSLSQGNPYSRIQESAHILKQLWRTLTWRKYFFIALDNFIDVWEYGFEMVHRNVAVISAWELERIVLIVLINIRISYWITRWHRMWWHSLAADTIITHTKKSTNTGQERTHSRKELTQIRHR